MHDQPCCEAEVLQRIRQIDVGGIVVGISMLDPMLAEVQAMDSPDEKEIGRELTKRGKIPHYISASAEEKYRIALLWEYQKFRGE